MPLIEHLRELRTRLVKSVAAIVVCGIVAAIFYRDLYDFIVAPYYNAIIPLAEREGFEAQLTITDVGGALGLVIKTSVVAGITAASPVWLYQLWAFIMPAMHQHEKRWTLLFVSIAGPLFVLGVTTGYYVLPKGMQILIGFTPENVSNLTTISSYLNFVLRLLLVFGVAFEIPLFVLLLNLVGVVSGRKLGEYRPWIIIMTFVFAAVATPSTDPVTMLFLALPMTLLFMVSEVIARIMDRRRGRGRDGDFASWADDEASPIAAGGAVSGSQIEAPSDLDADDDDVIRRDRDDDA